MVIVQKKHLFLLCFRKFEKETNNCTRRLEDEIDIEREHTEAVENQELNGSVWVYDFTACLSNDQFTEKTQGGNSNAELL